MPKGNPSPPCYVCGEVKIKAQGLCAKHYHRLQRHGDPRGGGPERLFTLGMPCRADGCDEPATGRGYCKTHCNRDRHSIPLDYKPAHRYKTPSGYVLIAHPDEWVPRKGGRQRRQVPEHRWFWEQAHGPLLPGQEVHHKNKIRDDNRLENLELWDTSQPAGARPEDIVTYWVERYPELAEAVLAGRSQLRLTI